MPNYDGSDHSPDLYEVTSGKHHHRTESGEFVRLTKGDTFHPTLKQVKQGSLENKATRVKRGSVRPSATVSADIGLRALEWGSEAALKRALDAGLDVEDLGEPSGKTGYVTSDVDAALEART